MAFLIYQTSDKKVVKRFNNSYDAEYFLREQSYEKKPSFNGFLFPRKFLTEFKMASVNDILTVKRGWYEFIVKHGPEVYILPEPNKGFLKKILEAINHLVGRSLKSTEERRHL